VLALANPKGYDRRMIRSTLRFALPLIAIYLASCAPQVERPRAIPQSANPSSIVATEMAFSREASEKGENAAFRRYAAKDALVFRPQPVLFSEYSKGVKDSGVATKWQPHSVYMSCDGRTAIATGAWQTSDANGYFTTVWQWFPKSRADATAQLQGVSGEGEWKWTLRHGDALKKPMPRAEMIETKSASCKGRASAPLSAPPVGAKMKAGYSFDQSLQWTWVVTADGARSFQASVWDGTALQQVIAQNVAARP
jgi:hypothetical protein